MKELGKSEVKNGESERSVKFCYYLLETDKT